MKLRNTLLTLIAVTALSACGDDAKEAASNAAAAAKDTVTETAKGMAEKAGDSAKAMVETTKEAATEAVTAAKDTVTETAKGVAEKASDSAKAMVETTKEAAGEMKEAATNAVKEATPETNSNDAGAAIDAAKAAEAGLKEISFEWRDMKKMMKKAEKLASEGKAEKAIAVANMIVKHAEQAQIQAKAAKGAGPRF